MDIKKNNKEEGISAWKSTCPNAILSAINFARASLHKPRPMPAIPVVILCSVNSLCCSRLHPPNREFENDLSFDMLIILRIFWKYEVRSVVANYFLR